MPEQNLYELGKQPKVLAYIDQEKGLYIQKTFQLRKQISVEALREFFNKIYSMKLDNGYSNSFEGEYNTGDLTKCFIEILRSKDLVELNKLLSIINKKETKFPLPIIYAIRDFFAMFQIVHEQRYSIKEYDIMVSQGAMNPPFCKDTLPKQEQQIVENNSRAMGLVRKKGKGMMKMQAIGG